MIPLAQLQRQFQRHLLAADPAIASSINETENVPAALRLAIYSEAYRLRLIDALASNFPRLQQLLGETEFAAIASTYVDSHPSTFRSIRWFGAALPACLEISHPKQPWLADLACWEWAIATAFDASDAASIEAEALGQISPDRWPGLQFEFHPSLQRILVKSNAPALFKALGDDEPRPEPQVLEREQPWLIWRQRLKTNYRSLSNAEAEVLDLLAGGGSFETMCDALCASCEADDVPLRAAAFLKGWIADELIVGLRSNEEPA